MELHRRTAVSSSLGAQHPSARRERKNMKRFWMIVCILIAAFGFAQAPSESFPAMVPMKQLMVDLVYPASNDLLLSIYRGGPQDENEWAAVRRSAVTLTESGNLLMMPGRARDGGRWMSSVKMLVDAGTAASKSAQAKDLQALAAVAGPLDASCRTCHQQYRPEVFPRGQSQ